MKMEMIIVPVSALLVGAVLGWGVTTAFLEPEVVVESVKEESPDELKLVPVESEETDRLRRENAQLKAESEQQKEQLAELKRQREHRRGERSDRRFGGAQPAEGEGEGEEREVVRQERPQGGGRGDWVERMKNEDPQRYNEWTNRMARMGEQMRAQARDQQSFFDFDTSLLSASDRERVEHHRELMAARDQLMEQMQTATPEERRQLGPQMGEIMGALNQSNGQVRDVLLKQKMTECGFSDQDATAMVSELKGIFQATENGGFGGPGGRGGFGGGGNRGGNRGGRGGRR